MNRTIVFTDVNNLSGFSLKYAIATISLMMDPFQKNGGGGSKFFLIVNLLNLFIIHVDLYVFLTSSLSMMSSHVFFHKTLIDHRFVLLKSLGFSRNVGH